MAVTLTIIPTRIITRFIRVFTTPGRSIAIRSSVSTRSSIPTFSCILASKASSKGAMFGMAGTGEGAACMFPPLAAALHGLLRVHTQWVRCTSLAVADSMAVAHFMAAAGWAAMEVAGTAEIG